MKQYNDFEKYLKGYCLFKILFASENLLFEPHRCLFVLLGVSPGIWREVPLQGAMLPCASVSPSVIPHW